MKRRKDVDMKDLADLFLTFCRIGGFTFGGGYAMLPMIQREVVQKKRWATDDEVMDYFAVGQCAPGVIAVNTATFIGYKRRGILGGIVATAGVVFPSLIIIMIIAAFLNNFSQLPVVQHAFEAIRAVVGVLICNAVIRMWKKTVIDKICALLAIVAFFASAIFDVSPIIIVLAGGAIGILLPVLKGVKKV